MNFIFGRSNLALTVFVPWDCSNHCEFCTSKSGYKVDRPNMQNVEYQLKKFFSDYNFPVRDVVFTGGEPMMNVQGLADLIDLIPSDKRIFINTTFTKSNLDAFVDLVNNSGRIDGVNISRHGEHYFDDRKHLCDIAEDDAVTLLKCPVRINCVLGNQNIDSLIERWINKDVVLNLRMDYTKMDSRRLHDPYDPACMYLLQKGYKFLDHTQCNVCDTTSFKHHEEGMPIVMYHKGLQDSSVLHDDTLEINDLIITQSGDFRYDWFGSSINLMEELLKKHKKAKQVELKVDKVLPDIGTSERAVTSMPYSACGGYYYDAGCGGSTRVYSFRPCSATRPYGARC